MKLSYKNIQKVAVRFCRRYKQTHKVPKLPNTNQLKKYNNLLRKKYSKVIAQIKKYLDPFRPPPGRGLDHLESIATLAAFIAEKECRFRKLPLSKQEKIINKAILSGLLHDIERSKYKGGGEGHMIEGARRAQQILTKLNIEDNIVIKVVRNHDKLDFEAKGDEILEVVFGAVFDADHFRYATEREEEFWMRKERQGMPPQEVIHYYQKVSPLRDAWWTNYGKKVGPKLIDYALAVSKHVEKVFSPQESDLENC